MGQIYASIYSASHSGRVYVLQHATHITQGVHGGLAEWSKAPHC